MTTHYAQVRLPGREEWRTVTRPVTPLQAARYLRLMLDDAGVPADKIERAEQVLMEGRELAGKNGRAFRVVPVDGR